METSNPKTAIVDKIKKSTNILVTVSHSPSVDALAAALGFSLMLNKLDKHATAVFSGTIPPAITFLEPEKTFENTVDGLRDFIIALDKSKADRLRYKVEGDVVRIYITPYRTNISEADLQYSQGDFNIDLVIALGVGKQSDIDNAISAHGRILHDATIATINLSGGSSTGSQLDWSDDKASSLCEMLMSLSEALQSNLLDEQIATALLTGIVAATDRFSNAHTSPRVMTMSAQLMAAGANQQLISEKLQAGGESLDIEAAAPTPPAAPATPPPADGEMRVDHEAAAGHADEPPAPSETSDADRQAESEAESRLDAALGHTQPRDHLREELEKATAEQSPPAHSTDWRDHVYDPAAPADEEPLLGGTLNATTSEAEEAKKREQRSSRNRTILHHDDVPADADDDDDDAPTAGGQGNVNDVPRAHDPMALSKGKTLQPVTMKPIASPTVALPVDEPPLAPPPPLVTPFPATDSVPPPPVASVFPESQAAGLSYEETPVPPVATPAAQTLAELEAQVHAAAEAQPTTSSINDARSAVQDAFAAQPLSVGGQPTPAVPQAAPADQPGAPALPPLPPMPDFSTLPPLPPAPSYDAAAAPHPAVMPPTFPATPAPEGPLTPPAPGQFRIPGAP